MKGKIQYQFAGNKEAKTKEKNFVISFKNLFQLLLAVLKTSKKLPNKIYIFFE